jgi:hypothetical protein
MLPEFALRVNRWSQKTRNRYSVAPGLYDGRNSEEQEMAFGEYHETAVIQQFGLTRPTVSDR